MYNGIGLQTARGSGTNGYVQRNFAFVRNKKDRVDYKTEEEIKKLDAATIKKPNLDILNHERKRKVELKCMEMEELMAEQGYSEDEILEKVSAFRQALSEEAAKSSDYSIQKDEHGRPIVRESHQMAEMNQEKNARLREAFGINKYYIDGSSLDPERKTKEAAIAAAMQIMADHKDGEPHKKDSPEISRRRFKERDSKKKRSATKRHRSESPEEMLKKDKKKKSEKRELESSETRSSRKRRSSKKKSRKRSSSGSSSQSPSVKPKERKRKKKMRRKKKRKSDSSSSDESSPSRRRARSSSSSSSSSSTSSSSSSSEEEQHHSKKKSVASKRQGETRGVEVVRSHSGNRRPPVPSAIGKDDKQQRHHQHKNRPSSSSSPPPLPYHSRNRSSPSPKRRISSPVNRKRPQSKNDINRNSKHEDTSSSTKHKDTESPLPKSRQDENEFGRNRCQVRDRIDNNSRRTEMPRMKSPGLRNVRDADEDSVNERDVYRKRNKGDKETKRSNENERRCSEKNKRADNERKNRNEPPKKGSTSNNFSQKTKEIEIIRDQIRLDSDRSRSRSLSYSPVAQRKKRLIEIDISSPPRHQIAPATRVSPHSSTSAEKIQKPSLPSSNNKLNFEDKSKTSRDLPTTSVGNRKPRNRSNSSSSSSARRSRSSSSSSSTSSSSDDSAQKGSYLKNKHNLVKGTAGDNKANDQKNLESSIHSMAVSKISLPPIASKISSSIPPPSKWSRDDSSTSPPRNRKSSRSSSSSSDRSRHKSKSRSLSRSTHSRSISNSRKRTRSRSRSNSCRRSSRRQSRSRERRRSASRSSRSRSRSRSTSASRQRSPSIPRRRGSPSFLEKRRITRENSYERRAQVRRKTSPRRRQRSRSISPERRRRQRR